MNIDSSNKPLLTIAIPTYNRSENLDLCLTQIFKQMGDFKKDKVVEIVVYDNCSTDQTSLVVEKHRALHSFKYSCNTQNIGAEKNIAQCFKEATGKYVLIFGDDDVMLDGALKKILNVLQNGEYGIVHLKASYYTQDFVSEPSKTPDKETVIVYDEIMPFFHKVNFFFTFISGNIINKQCAGDINPDQFIGSGLPQLGWTLQAALNSKQNAFISETMLSAKADNTGGYKLCEVFGTNMNKIFQNFINQGISKSYFDVINSYLAKQFFPVHIYLSRTVTKKFVKEDYFKELFPSFKRHKNFWIYTVPVIFLPGFFLKSVRWTMQRLRLQFSRKK